MSEYKYQEENNQVLDFIINHTFFINQKRDYTLELILTPECNQKCEYCYLQKYKHDLYPKESYEHDKILQNLDYLFNFLKENNIYIPKIDLFSGEIWGSEFGITILDKVYNHYKNYKFSNKIGIPSNMTFLLNSKYKTLIQKYIDLFKELNVKLYFSASVDGKILEETSRPLNSGKIKEDNFYKEVFEFAQKNNFGFHPMLSATNVHNWKENFDWFIQEYQKYKIIGMAPMILEVRDNNWNADSLNSYKEFLNYIIET
jgi:sulfatase maturation enzyme AslB (radical SAM superfamily)